MVDNLAVQNEPEKHGFLQKKLEKGTRVIIIKHWQGWLQIFHGGEVGFIRDEPGLVKIILPKKIEPPRNQPSQSEDTKDQIETLKKQAIDINRQIEKSQAEVQKFSQQEMDLINSLNKADLALNQSKKRLAALNSEIAGIEKKIRAAGEASKVLMKQIDANKHYVGKRLVALYKLNRLGQFQVVASAETINDLLQRKAALERILVYDEKIRNQLAANQVKLENVLAELKNQRRTKAELIAAYDQQRDAMSQERSKRAELLAEIGSQKSLELAAIEFLKQSAKDLDQEINTLTQKDNSVSIEESRSQKPFFNYKGLLNLPVEGKIIHSYGPYKNARFNVLNFRSGIDIEAEKGEPVRAVYGGKIVYSGWFKGYGNMIIIDHGNNYHTIYAHVDDLFKSRGDAVEAGEVIATVGDTGSMTGPKLHFEVRHHGKALDPLKWLKSG
jgi:septal ring factor EnvC (AmiA/AmiB activator)